MSRTSYRCQTEWVPEALGGEKEGAYLLSLHKESQIDLLQVVEQYLYKDEDIQPVHLSLSDVSSPRCCFRWWGGYGGGG